MLTGECNGYLLLNLAAEVKGKYWLVCQAHKHLVNVKASYAVLPLCTTRISADDFRTTSSRSSRLGFSMACTSYRSCEYIVLDAPAPEVSICNGSVHVPWHPDRHELPCCCSWFEGYVRHTVAVKVHDLRQCHSLAAVTCAIATCHSSLYGNKLDNLQSGLFSDAMKLTYL